MALSIASNSESIAVQTDLARTTRTLSKTFERLSSGLRIISASDDPAGLVLASKLGADAKIAAVAIRNANEGLSITSLTNEALEETDMILQRMGELATQSANGSYTNPQRSALSSEFQALGSEVERIARTTSYNGFNLLSASQNITLQVGLDSTANSRITLTGVTGTLNALGLGNASGVMTFSIIDTTSTGSQAAAQTAMSVVNAAISSLTTVRGTVGAGESRLTSAVNYLSVVRENFAAAEGKIRDADVAHEVALMVRLQVLQQAETAILAQANQQPQVALKLLA